MIFTNSDPPATARLLLVDDDLKFCKLMTGYLEAQGFVIGVAHDGAAALQLAKEAAWDLVVLDVMMPGLEGFGLLRALRSDPRTALLPIVLLSARAGEEAGRAPDAAWRRHGLLRRRYTTDRCSKGRGQSPRPSAYRGDELTNWGP